MANQNRIERELTAFLLRRYAITRFTRNLTRFNHRHIRTVADLVKWMIKKKHHYRNAIFLAFLWKSDGNPEYWKTLSREWKEYIAR